ncbi:MAG: hypothetical protein LAQ30_08405 [Acidobacteriia bacterium]|nr:hypothetical protein [Terriglobia bacterium]
MKRTTAQILLVAAAASALSAQNQLAGPVSGFVFDAPARVLRPILGIPGASLVGDPLGSAADVQAAYVAPRQDSALLVTSSARFVRLNSAGAAPLACGGLAERPEAVVFSPSGTSAAVYAAGRVQIVSGLPDAPAVSAELPLTLGRRRAPQASPARGRHPATASFAVSDDGRYLLAAIGGSIRLYGTSGENFSIMDAGLAPLMAFAPGGHDAAIADASSGITLVRDVAGAAVRTALAVEGETARPAGLAFSADGGRLLFAASSAVTAFDLRSGSRSVTVCDCEPAGLFPMGGLFRLNELGAGPLWLYDPRGDAPRFVFVPARTE